MKKPKAAVSHRKRLIEKLRADPELSRAHLNEAFENPDAGAPQDRQHPAPGRKKRMRRDMLYSSTTTGPLAMHYNIEYEQEEDGRWLAEVLELPGVLAYGQTADEAMAKAEVLALRVLAETLDHGERKPEPITITFKAA